MTLPEGVAVFDLDHTLVDSRGTKLLYPDAEPVLYKLQQLRYELLLLTAERDVAFQRDKINRCKLTRFFPWEGVTFFGREFITVVEVPEHKSEVLEDIRDRARQAGYHGKLWDIGDRVQFEIRYGNQFGYHTVWTCRSGGKYSDRGPRTTIERPTHVITTLDELIPICTSVCVK
jgi:hypothetical protein